MRIPLMLAWNPRGESKKGPVVRLGPGKWRIVEEGVIDSLLSYDPQPVVLENETFILGPSSIQCQVLCTGNEHCLNSYAELVGG